MRKVWTRMEGESGESEDVSLSLSPLPTAGRHTDSSSGRERKTDDRPADCCYSKTLQRKKYNKTDNTHTHSITNTHTHTRTNPFCTAPCRTMHQYTFFTRNATWNKNNNNRERRSPLILLIMIIKLPSLRNISVDSQELSVSHFFLCVHKISAPRRIDDGGRIK